MRWCPSLPVALLLPDLEIAVGILERVGMVALLGRVAAAPTEEERRRSKCPSPPEDLLLLLLPLPLPRSVSVAQRLRGGRGLRSLPPNPCLPRLSLSLQGAELERLRFFKGMGVAGGSEKFFTRSASPSLPSASSSEGRPSVLGGAPNCYFPLGRGKKALSIVIELHLRTPENGGNIERLDGRRNPLGVVTGQTVSLEEWRTDTAGFHKKEGLWTHRRGWTGRR